MTLKEDEDSDLNSPASRAGRQAAAKTKSLIRCIELAAVIPIILLLLPLYALIQLYAAAVAIHRILRGIHRHAVIRNACIPDVCGASQKLRLR